MNDAMKKATRSAKNDKIVFTPAGRMVWPHLFEKWAGKDGDGEPKFGCMLLFPKDVDLTELKKLMNEAAHAKFGDKAKDMTLRNPIRKTSDLDKLAEYADEFPTCIGPRSSDRPGIVGPNAKRVDEPEQVYGGRWARFSVDAYGYDTKGNKGVTFGLQNVQLLDHDEPMGGGRVAAEKEFEPVDAGGSESGGETTSDDVFAGAFD